MSPLFIKRSCRRKRHGWRTFLSIYYYNFGTSWGAWNGCWLFKTTTFFNIYYIINLIKINSKIKSLSVIQLLDNNKLSLFKNSTLIFLFYYFPRCWKCQVSRKGLIHHYKEKDINNPALRKRCTPTCKSKDWSWPFINFYQFKNLRLPTFTFPLLPIPNFKNDLTVPKVQADGAS